MNKKDLYEQEAKEKWGETEAYKEFEKKKMSDDELEKSGKEIIDILIEFGKVMNHKEEGIKLVQKLQDCISNNFYKCSDEILLSLGNMYIENEEMKKHIELASGIGTPDFVRECIIDYVNNK